MVAEKFERYEISSVPDGLQIVSWQALPSLGIGVVALVILAACYLTDPYPGHGRVWAGLGVAALVLVALFGVRVERWIISESLVQYKSSIWNKEQLLARSAGTPLSVRVELAACDQDLAEPAFLHIVHVIPERGTEFGDGFLFRTRTNVDRFLETVRTVVPLDVIEVRPASALPDDASDNIRQL